MTSKEEKSQFQFILLYIITLLCVIFTLYWEKELRINQYLQEKTTSTKTNYDSLYHEYKKIANIIFLTKINQPEILQIIAKTKGTSKIEQQKLRDSLYISLQDTYGLLNHYNLRQLHFHLPNSESFLRFHRPTKFGDNLSGVRETIDFVNRYKQPIDGFEEGRIFNGYRFVYPLSYENTHIGSVEVSFSTSEFAKEFDEDFETNSFFLVSKELVDKKVFKEEKGNYTTLFLDSFYLLNDKSNKKQDLKIQDFSNKIANHTMIEQQIFKGKPFSIVGSNTCSVITFIPIENPITKNISAVQVVKQYSSYIKNKILLTNILAVVLFSLLSLIFYFLYLNSKHKKELEEKINMAVSDMRYKDMIMHRQSKAAALGEMIDAIGHQWKTPLSVIKFYAQDMKNILKSEEDNQQEELFFNIDKIVLQTQHLSETVDSFREFFRPISTLEEVNLKELLDNTLFLVKDELIRHNIIPSFSGNFEVSVCLVPNEFKHLLLNLVKNSKDAFVENNTRDRTILFHIEKINDNEVDLEVTDNAGGIPNDAIEHIFEPHFTTKSPDLGTGIGLYISRQILDKIGAEISVSNTNNGAKFVIKIYKACRL